MRDLVVAGGGPVGLATALYAARAGLDVVVREPRRGVVDKACGEGLMPGAVQALAGLGVRPDGHPIAGIRYVDGDRRVDAPFGSAGLGVRRTVLHAALRSAVDAAGVCVEDRPVEAVVQHADRVVVDGEPARHLVAADGLHSPLRRRLGLDAAAPGPRRYGLRAHYATAPWTPYVEVHWSAHAEAYVTPVGPDLVGVAVLSSRPGPFAELLAEFPALTTRLAGQPVASKARGAGPLRQRSRRRVAGRVLLVGDAAGYVDALTGEGIASGLAQARVAVDAVAAGEPAGYERAWRRVTRRHDLMTHALLSASRRPAVRARLVPAAAALPWVFRAAVHELARPA